MRGTRVVKWADFWCASSEGWSAHVSQIISTSGRVARGTLEHIVGYAALVTQRSSDQFFGSLQGSGTILGSHPDENIQSKHGYKSFI